jgi:hypothetical protein
VFNSYENFGCGQFKVRIKRYLQMVHVECLRKTPTVFSRKVNGV